MSLDTLANVKTRIGISGATDDALVSLLMDSADSWVGNYTGRDFIGGTYTEYFPGNVEFLHLANFPVTALTSVKVDPAGAFGSDTVIAATAYTLQSERGIIQSKVGPFVAVVRSPGLVNDDRADWKRSPRAVQVVYATATGSVPNDVKQAYAMLIAYWYRQVKTQSATNFQPLSRQRYGDVLLEYRLDKLLTLPPPEDVQRLLAPYRTPNV